MFTDDVKDFVQTENIFVIWICIKIKCAVSIE